MMDVQELALAAQYLSFEQRKELIKKLFAQLPKTESLAGSIVEIGDLEAGTEEIRERINESLQRSAGQFLAQASEHISKTPGVCGGKACVAGTRLRVMDVVIWHERLGWSADEIISQIPGATLSDVYAALAYYFDYREEIEEDIRLNDEVAEKLQAGHSSNQHNPNLVWLEDHRAEFAGQWVVLHNGKLIAHSTDGEALVEPVRQAEIRNPMIVFVEPPSAEVFVGF